ncbi:ribosomal protein S18 acetylase RimI-like enzyme [Metabacillus malikii]|uniref:Ribosomal protein S18 acetylase RimI-like enzyme n=1 Tax=Metabacillus malikii TaxID=1504265 RepID=A0ABT9ZK27_9BACI|nr:ribosomal protein S18 acetylase RimI-like enzyme [Metabacillus malikii]
MIKEINISNRENAEKVLAIQLPSYKVEAEIIGFDDIPPLKDTVSTLQQCGESFFGYFSDEELCGFISFKKDDNIIDIHRLVVHPNYFKKGIAQELFDFLEGHVDSSLVKVATGSKNTPAVRFYLKNGFVVVREVTVNERLSLSFFEKRR